MNFNYESQIKAYQIKLDTFCVKNGELLKHRITVLCTEGVKRKISMLIGQAYSVKLSCARDAQHQFYTKFQNHLNFN